MVKVVALARPLADAGEHRVAAEEFRDVVHEFHDQNGLAHAGAAEQADLAAFGVGAEQVDDLDTRRRALPIPGLVDEVRSRRVDRAHQFAAHRAGSSIGSPMTFMMRPRVAGPTGTMIGWPRSATAWPRTRPSVESMAMVRTVFSPRC